MIHQGCDKNSASYNKTLLLNSTFTKQIKGCDISESIAATGEIIKSKATMWHKTGSFSNEI